MAGMRSQSYGHARNAVPALTEVVCVAGDNVALASYPFLSVGGESATLEPAAQRSINSMQKDGGSNTAVTFRLYVRPILKTKCLRRSRRLLTWR